MNRQDPAMFSWLVEELVHCYCMDHSFIWTDFFLKKMVALGQFGYNLGQNKGSTKAVFSMFHKNHSIRLKSSQKFGVRTSFKSIEMKQARSFTIHSL